MNMKLESVTRFDKGITGNIDSVFHQHFDIFSDPHRLIPYRSTEAEANATSAANLGTYYPRHFLLAKSGKMYALGNNLSGKAQILEKVEEAFSERQERAKAAGDDPHKAGGDSH